MCQSGLMCRGEILLQVPQKCTKMSRKITGLSPAQILRRFSKFGNKRIPRGEQHVGLTSQMVRKRVKLFSMTQE